MFSSIRQMMVSGMIVGSLALGPASALAQGDAQLSSTWSYDKTDLSLIPGFHVARLDRDGVKYIQVFRADGTLLVTFAASNGQFLRLPMGTARLSTPQQRTAGTGRGSAPAATVYDDGAVQVRAVTEAGTTTFAADCGSCSGGGRQN